MKIKVFSLNVCGNSQMSPLMTAEYNNFTIINRYFSLEGNFYKIFKFFKRCVLRPGKFLKIFQIFKCCVVFCVQGNFKKC